MTTKTKPATQEEMEANVKALLKNLGAGPNKVAEKLVSLKIKGDPGYASSCPVARFIRKNFKSLKNIEVTESVSFDYRGEGCCVELPSAVEKFVGKFDDGDYPELES